MAVAISFASFCAKPRWPLCEIRECCASRVSKLLSYFFFFRMKIVLPWHCMSGLCAASAANASERICPPILPS